MSTSPGTWLPPYAAYLALALVVVANAIGNVLLKLGSTTGRSGYLVLGAVPIPTLAGIGCFALAIVLYAWALRVVELHFAQIVVSLQYVAVIALSVVLLGEQISPQRWIGIALILVGLLICAR